MARDRGFLGMLLPDAAPIDLRILGRTLLHAALVGLAAGAVGALFFAGVEYVQHWLLEGIAGYRPLRAYGETFVTSDVSAPFRWWVLLVLPAAGALVGGIVSAKFAPETQGGGGDAMIHAFHHQGGMVRRRVVWVKTLASMATLGSGGSGGREGPTMQIGAALGSLVGRALRVGVRERRILLVAGVAAGIAAVFRTPLGAALLAVEVLYRDDFESDALIPAVLASVASYAVVISVFGESTMFAHAPRYPFVPAHLPYYGLLALLVSMVALLFVETMHRVKKVSARLKLPLWAKPGLGGLALGLVATPAIYYMGQRVGQPGQGLGLLGGGYGGAQMAITGSDWLPEGWGGVELLLLLCLGKIVCSALTIGSGGSAGDFAPSLVIGGLFGGAFGRALQLIVDDPRIDPGAFALVGMGTFYGGIAHVPLSSAILTCELAGSYDLLVPLMLAEGVAFVALRKRTLYPAQVRTQKESPTHRDALVMDVLRGVKVREVVVVGRPYLSFEAKTPAAEMVKMAGEATWQDVFPVIEGGVLKGMVTSDALRMLAGEQSGLPFTIAADVMMRAVVVGLEDDVRAASQVMLSNGLRELLVVDEGGRIIGFLDEADVAKAYLEATKGARGSTVG